MPWNTLTQAQRNQAIINAGMPQVGQNTGLTCKEWVRAVVQSASAAAGGPTRTIPSTQTSPNDYMWVYDQYVVGFSPNIQTVDLGVILQLKQFNGTPHTAIVSARDGSGVTLLDCNWATQPDYIVRNHFMSFTTFAAKFANYSGYLIL